MLWRCNVNMRYGTATPQARDIITSSHHSPYAMQFPAPPLLKATIPDDRSEPHRNRAQKHRQDWILEDPTSFIKEMRPTRDVQRGESSEQHDVQKPKAPSDIA